MKKVKYYLFAYLCIDPVSWSENVARRTDQNMAVFSVDENNVELIAYYELERYTGLKKHEKSFRNVSKCKTFINEILHENGLSLDQIDVIWGTKELEKGIGAKLHNEISRFFTNSSFYPHQYFHLFSCLHLDTKKNEDEMLAFAVDGGPDFVDVDEIKPYYYAGCYRRNKENFFFPVYSPGPLWTLAKNRFKIKEGTLMALASACKTQLLGFNVPPPLVSNSSDLIKAYEYFEQLLHYATTTLDEGDMSNYNCFDKEFSKEDCIISSVMKEIQKSSHYIMDINITNAQIRFGIDFSRCILGMSGGFALNCPTNTYLMENYRFRSFEAPPCVNDSGISLGMGLFYLNIENPQMNFKLHSAYHGYRITAMEMELCRDVYSSFIKDIQSFDPQKASIDIQNSPLLWLEGRSEIGPRSLGHRSIIADPRYIENKYIINERKLRPLWQPVAPIILDEYGDIWFENYFASPYMLHIFKFKQNKAEEVPAITHLDNTARIQSITENENILLFNTIKEFYVQTGVPLVCNTSLNDKGEPIINTLSQAINFALRKSFNVIYYNGERIELQNHKDFQETSFEKRKYHYYFDEPDIYDALKMKCNPLQLPTEILHYYFTSPNLMKKYDITSLDDAKKIKRIIKAEFFKSKIDVFIEQNA